MKLSRNWQKLLRINIELASPAAVFSQPAQNAGIVGRFNRNSLIINPSIRAVAASNTRRLNRR
jgi:hypothetical protein